MQNLLEILGLLGIVLFLIGYFNPSKPWNNKLKTAGTFCMAIHIISEAAWGFYDGFSGNTHN